MIKSLHLTTHTVSPSTHRSKSSSYVKKLLLGVIGLFALLSAHATNYYSYIGGGTTITATTTTNWTTDPTGNSRTGAFTTPANFTSGDIFTILPTATANIAAGGTWTISGAASGVVVNGTLTFQTSNFSGTTTLSISGSGGLIANGTVNFGFNIFGVSQLTLTGGDFIVNSGASASPNQYTVLTLAKNLTVNSGATFTGNATSELECNGTSLQTIGGTIASLTLGYLQIDNGATTSVTNTVPLTLSGSGSIVLTNAFSIGTGNSAGPTFTMGANITLSNSNEALMTGMATFNCQGYVLSGGAGTTFAMTNVNGGNYSTLESGNANGITSAGTNTGSIQTATRTFSSSGAYVYNASSGNQITGTGLPTTILALTINTSTSSQVVSLTNNNTLIKFQNPGGTLTLTNGIFKIGTGNTLQFGNGTCSITSTGGAIANSADGAGDANSDGGTILMTTNNTLSITSPAGAAGSPTLIIYSYNSSTNSTFTITNSNSLLINGTFTIPNNNFVWNTGNSPMWGAASTLSINCAGQSLMSGAGTIASNASKGWVPNTAQVIASSAGYPNNVTLINTGAQANNFSNASDWSINGVLTLSFFTGSSFDFTGNTADFKCGGLYISSGNTFKAPTSHDIDIQDLATNATAISGNSYNGDFYDLSTVFTPATGRYVNFTGGSGATCSTPQVISTTTTPYLHFDNIGLSGGTYVTLNNAVTLPVAANGILKLTSGILTTTSTNILSITNTAVTSITGAGIGSGSFINGPVKWSLLNAGTNSYVFPMGVATCPSTNTYLPFTFSSKNTNAGNVATVQAFASAPPGGTPDLSTIYAIDPTAYWSLSTSGGLTTTGSTVSISQPTAISPYNVIAESNAVGGTYTSYAGTPGTFGVTGSNNIGITSPWFFCFGGPESITTSSILGPYCDDSVVSVAFTFTGPLTSFTAQLSDASGSFAAPTAIGTGASSPITATIPIAAASGTGYRIRVISTSPAVTGTDNGSNLIIRNSYTWTGAVDSHWFTGANWACGGVPQYNTSVIIPSVTNEPVLDSSVTLSGLTLSTGATLGLGSSNYILTINGALTGTGTISGSSACGLTFGSTASSATLYMTSAANTLGALTLGDSTTTHHTITLGNALNIASTGTLTVGSTTGAALATGGFLTLLSDAFGSARVAAVPVNVSGVSLSTISGAVAVQCYIHAPSSGVSNSPRRAWRLITVPVTNKTMGTATTLYTSWQNSGTFVSGVGTMITAPTSVASPTTNGLDLGINGNYSAYTWSIATQALVHVTNTKTQTIAGINGTADNTPFFIFVRGDRTPNTVNLPGLATWNNTTLSGTGVLQLGDQTFSSGSMVTNGGLYMVGNPYASSVDLSMLGGDTAGFSTSYLGTNTVNRFYIWNANLNGSQGVGGYICIDDPNKALGYYTKSLGGSGRASIADKSIQSGEAFFIQNNAANTAAAITFKEFAKNTTNNFIYRPQEDEQVSGAPVTNEFGATLSLRGSDGTTYLTDGVVAQFNNAYCGCVDYVDAPKFSNIDEMFSLARDGQQLCIERRPDIVHSDTLFLNLKQMALRDYEFNFTTNLPNHPGIGAHIEDSFTHLYTPLNMSGSNTLDFTTGSDPASRAQNRFMVVFGALNITPAYTNINATRAGNTVVVQWSLSNDQQMTGYALQRSTDGINYTTIYTTIAIHNGNGYSFTDMNPVAGINYYRVLSTDQLNEQSYSAVVSVTIASLNPTGITVYPNPIQNGQIGLAMNNMAAGNYTYRLLNQLGQEIQKGSFVHSGGNATLSLPFNRSISQGTYELEIVLPDNTKTNISLVKVSED